MYGHCRIYFKKFFVIPQVVFDLFDIFNFRSHIFYGPPLNTGGYINTVECVGDEDSLMDCEHTNPSVADCDPLTESAGVMCYVLSGRGYSSCHDTITLDHFITKLHIYEWMR